MSVSHKPAMVFALSCPVNVRSVPPKGFTLELRTDERERRRLADNHDLVSVDKFSAGFQLRPWKKQGIRLQGRLTASIIQKCIITAEPVKNDIDQLINVIYIPQDSRLVKFSGAKFSGEEKTHELLLEAEGPDAPEILEGNEIDIGAVAEEFFELAIDPYPRKQGASFEAGHSEADRQGLGDEETKDHESPFAILRHLKQR